jgi:hypothetical protein
MPETMGIDAHCPAAATIGGTPCMPSPLGCRVVVLRKWLPSQTIIYVVPWVSAMVNHNEISSLDHDEWLYSRPMPGGVHPLAALLGLPQDGQYHPLPHKHGTYKPELLAGLHLLMDGKLVEVWMPGQLRVRRIMACPP